MAGRGAREFSKAEFKEAVAAREAGATIRDLEIKYKTSRQNLRQLGIVGDPVPRPGQRRRKRGRARKVDTVAHANAALRAAATPTPGPYLLTYLGAEENQPLEECETLQDALAQCVTQRLSGGSGLRLWREVKFKVTAVVEEK